jgi:hypothetical protein
VIQNKLAGWQALGEKFMWKDEPAREPFSLDGFLHHLTAFIVADDQVSLLFMSLGINLIINRQLM